MRCGGTMTGGAPDPSKVVPLPARLRPNDSLGQVFGNATRGLPENVESSALFVTGE
jgi:hypothetical protein